ncbi:MAG: MBOAT family O-acyltransferase [Myxococcota bacterium]
MLFNSLEFLVFFPVVTGLFYALPHRHRWWMLLVASYVFYCWWSLPYGLLLLCVSALDWWVAVKVQDATTAPGRRLWLGLSLLGNLGILFTFKYYNLVNDTFGAGFLWATGYPWPVPHSGLVLPIGISFHTFQSMSYTIDIYRGRYKAERHPGMFLLFVAYFPQLVAGPIERGDRLLPQLHRPVTFDWDRTVSGLRLAAWGMFKKVVIADRLAEVVNTVYGDPTSFGAFGHVVATFLFGYQVYCDFSGYSDIAIGIARILGVDMMRNFDQPYLARSMADLWGRWHLSMTTWFRDYVYLPLGGSRVPFWRWALNVMVVFVGSGLWHGAEWHFVLWGFVHAVLLIAERGTARPRRFLQDVTGLSRIPWLQAIVQWGCMTLCWQFTLVFFRADTFTDTVYILTHLGTGWAPLVDVGALAVFLVRLHLDGALFLYCLLLCPLTEVIDYGFRSPRIREALGRWPALPRWSLDWALLMGIVVFGSFGDTPFVYFQF